MSSNKKLFNISNFFNNIFIRNQHTSIILFGITIASLILLLYSFSANFSDELSTLISLIAYISMSLYLIHLVVKYLTIDKLNYNSDTESIRLQNHPFPDQRKIDNAVSLILKKELSKGLSADQDVGKLEKDITNKITENLEAHIISQLEQKYKNNFESEVRINEITQVLIPVTRNTQIYIDRIQRNSIVNLMFGILGTISAITILSFTILSDKSIANMQEFIMHLVPRFTFAVFIQLFAFFFLRLYKNNLEDAKYFQNELSNSTAKSTAIMIALLTQNNDLLNTITLNLASTERNFKLLKDETLHTIENKKLEMELDKDTLNQLREILAKFDTKN